MKKMKLIVSAILLFAGLQSTAATYSAGDKKFKDYQDAVLALTYNDNKSCHLFYPEIEDGLYFPFKINSLILEAETVTVSEGAQPILTFNTKLTPGKIDPQGIYGMVITITTDISYAKIESLTANMFRLGRVNSGNLLNPVMKDGFIFYKECKIK